MKKERVDILLVQQGLFTSREQAKRAVMAGQVVGKNDERLDKPGEKIDPAISLRVKGQVNPYVSRGGFKLAKAQDVFAIDFAGATVLDIGASTGGFTDVALQNGARLVYALDVGYNQLAWKLREDPQVVVMERQNFRFSQPTDFTQGQPTIAVTDVSFISLELILPPLTKILAPGGHLAALIKPQFEAGRDHVGKHGIVRDPAVHRTVLTKILDFAQTQGYQVMGLDFSPITGGSGNIEFLAYFKLIGQETPLVPYDPQTVDQVVANAWSVLTSKKI
ncbi:TlyA family RNA methyltransferase [Lapidilactobacillus achengensis]|uniref:TlyA family RNA methyltransferase n=1 Tax=Lapidilactobacillus achengensis TaxID=2486000 RepID=A0ABW1UPS0_9LACO|nr:TlyA family RNA methyltransferase [Lapidilactobacillus achengensis]